MKIYTRAQLERRDLIRQAWRRFILGGAFGLGLALPLALVAAMILGIL